MKTKKILTIAAVAAGAWWLLKNKKLPFNPHGSNEHAELDPTSLEPVTVIDDIKEELENVFTKDPDKPIITPKRKVASGNSEILSVVSK